MSLRASLSELLRLRDPWEGRPQDLVKTLGLQCDVSTLTRGLKEHRDQLAQHSIYLEPFMAGSGADRVKLLRVSSTPPDQAAKFFQLLYGDQPQGHLVIWTKQGEDKRTSAFASPEMARKASRYARAQDQAGYDVYFGLGLQEEAPTRGRRGSEDKVCCVPGVWLDLDIAGAGHASSKGTHCPDLDTAQEIIARFPLAPTIMVHSGGGLHVYWLFPEPQQIQSAEERGEARALNMALQACFRHPAVNPEGFVVDTTHDLARVFRVPTTHNHKGEPKPVQVLAMNAGNRYSQESLRMAMAFFPASEVPEKPKPGPSKPDHFVGVNNMVPALPASLSDYTADEVFARAQAHLERAEPVTSGSRSFNAFRLSAVIRNDFAFDLFGLETKGEALLHAWNARNPNPLPKEKVEQCYKDGLRYAKEPQGCKVLDRAPNIHQRAEREASAGGAQTRNASRESGTKPARKPQASLDPSEFEEPGEQSFGPGSSIRDKMSIPDHFPDLYEPDSKWRVRSSGIYAYNAQKECWEQKFATPIVVTGRFKSAETGDELADLAWPSRQGWQSHTFERAHIADATAVAKLLGAKGYLIHSGLGRGMAGYLVDFLARNEDQLPVQVTASCFGWKGSKTQPVGFLVGDTLEGSSNPQAVRFHGGEGMASLERGMAEAGSLSGWKTAFDLTTKHPRSLLCMYASFAAPLLHVLRANSFVVDLCGETSRGKTSTLRGCASVWGSPETSDSDALIQSWNTTQVAVERHCGTMCHLPILLDDTKPVMDKAMVARVVYMIANNQSRGRGTPKGIQERKAWRTVAISTGESRIRQMSRESGKNTRLVTLWGDAFEGPSAAQDVQAIRRAIASNYGVVGRLWVRWLHANLASWDSWRTQWGAIRELYSNMGENAPEVDRLAEYLASLEMARQLVHECFPDLVQPASPLETLWDSIFNEVKEADSPSEALRVVYDWCASNRHRFFQTHSHTHDTPMSGWAGRWDTGKNLCLYAHVLDEILRKQGFDPAEMRQRWADRDWIECEFAAGRRVFSVQTRVDRQKVRLTAFKREFLQEICGAEDVHE